MIKNIFLLIAFILTLNLAAQDKRYTHNAENGFMWLDFDKRMIMRDLKYEFLSSLLEKQNVLNSHQFRFDSLDCKNDIKFLIETGKADKIELSDMVKKIDNFYATSDYLIIPIMYAYCYCIKEMAGYRSIEMENYISKVLEFSNSELKK